MSSVMDCAFLENNESSLFSILNGNNRGTHHADVGLDALVHAAIFGNSCSVTC